MLAHLQQRLPLLHASWRLQPGKKNHIEALLLPTPYVCVYAEAHGLQNCLTCKVDLELPLELLLHLSKS